MRKLINIKLISILSILAMFTPLFSFLFYAPVCAATTVTVIAASNSTIQWKSQATVVCDGTSDQVEINAYLNTGNTVELAPGTFNINGAIEPASYTHLYGQGDTTIINEVSSGIDCIHSSNIELDHFKIIGVSDGSGSLFIGAYGADRSNFYIHDIQCTTLGEQLDFILYANNYTLSNIVYSRCDAYNPDGFGFYIAGTNPSLVENVTYYKCTVENAGVAASRTNIWATGFDFAETTGLTINHLQAIDCSVSGAWESDFHFEDAPTKQDVIITGCSATRAGQKPSPTFGYGFVSTSGDVIFCNNSASNNSHGDLDLDGITHTPIVDGISPANSTKTATPVNQGNCSGVLVNIDSIHKELVLFSNDGNAVNQQIELGAVYTADDGNTYTFNGSKIITQFTNYAVIRLVKSNTSNLNIPTTSLSNGTVGVTYSQTLTVAGGTPPYTWSIASGTLPTGLALNSIGVISGTPTTACGPTSVTCKVTDSSSATATAALTITISGTTVNITTSSLPNGTIGMAYSQNLTATGGTTTYTWSIATGTLPNGLSLSSGGVISGAPTSAGGPTSITFKVTDATSASATKILPITIGYAAWDVNKDGAVNVVDMTSISQHCGETGTAGWIAQDVNYDGIINSLDMIIVGQHWTP